MADTKDQLLPVITAILITPNPVDCGASFKISVTVEEKQITLDPERRYSGEAYPGEF